MKKLVTVAALLAAAPGLAAAGGLDRSGQGVGIIFEKGNYAELSFGNVNPTVSGTYVGGAFSSGDMAPSYNVLGAGVKYDFSEMMSFALIIDQPWGASVAYPTGAGTFAATAGATAEVNTIGTTALIKYKATPNVSVFGGLRYNTITKADVSVPAVAAYNLTAQRSSALGYVIGGAYEIPDIALRLALTYSSETTHDIAITETGGGAPGASTMRVTLPKSVNLDFQTGVAANTIVMAGVRWANWTSTDINPPSYRAATASSLLSYTEDTYSFSLGVGRKFSEQWAGSATLGWERPQGGVSGNLSPTDGNVSLSLGAAYTQDNMKISGGVRYVRIGDATSAGGGGFQGTFANNTAVGLGLKVGFSF